MQESSQAPTTHATEISTFTLVWTVPRTETICPIDSDASLYRLWHLVSLCECATRSRLYFFRFPIDVLTQSLYLLCYPLDELRYATHCEEMSLWLATQAINNVLKKRRNPPMPRYILAIYR